MRKIYLSLLLVVVCLLTACSNRNEKSDYYIYYLNMDVTSVVEEAYEPASLSSSPEDLAYELLERLQGEPGTATLRQTLPSDLEYSIFIAGYIINVDFDSHFYDLSVVEQTLIRAALVRTLTQVPGCSYVNITVNQEPLMDSDGKIIGSMSADSFVENPGAQINSKQTTEITLYFADATDPTKLKRKVETITYTNKSLEKVVMEKLIEGPLASDSMIGTIPQGTRIITSSIYDGVCYINLNDAFIYNQNNEITEQVLLYSIVNSLCSLDDVSKVQITVNGETSGKVRYNYELSTFYEMDESIVDEAQKNDAATEIIESTEEGVQNQ